MAFNTDSTGTTLTSQEMAAEAERILERLRGLDQTCLTRAAREFLQQKTMELDLNGSASCNIKQLFWLREINYKVD